jgi:transcriptional regulator with XRE-family HTH domain
MVGYKIKRYREMRNYSQEYLADKLGISQNAYSKIETKQTKLTVDRLKKIASVLEIPEEELLNSDPMIFTFNNHDYAKGHANFGTIYETQKELYEKTIDHLKDEVIILRKEKESLMELIKTVNKK